MEKIRQDTSPNALRGIEICESRDSHRLEEINKEMIEKKQLISSHKNFLVEELTNLSLEMALCKYREVIVSRLEAEAELEKWDIMKENQSSRLESIINKVFPEPHLHDPLLCALDIDTWEKLRIRVRDVLSDQNSTNPANCAKSYLMAFATKNDRLSLISKLKSTANSLPSIPNVCSDIINYQQSYLELEQEKHLLQASNDDIKDIVLELNNHQESLKNVEKELEKINDELLKNSNERDKVKDEISSYDEYIKQTLNSRTLIELSSNLHSVFSEWADALKPQTIKNLENITTKKFIEIADVRFQGGQVIISEKNSSNGKPVFINKHNEYEFFETMAGFERRAFGIAYTLALTELTKYRAPLVIDTPLGNADSQYRQKLLEALSKADLDQIIILSHDQEITEELHNEVIQPRISDDDGTYFLVEFDQEKEESFVSPDKFFF
jgi:DNA sulfur modification protein DndD